MPIFFQKDLDDDAELQALIAGNAGGQNTPAIRQREKQIKDASLADFAEAYTKQHFHEVHNFRPRSPTLYHHINAEHAKEIGVNPGPWANECQEALNKAIKNNMMKNSTLQRHGERAAHKPVTISQNTFSDRTRCIVTQLRPGFSFSRSALAIL